MRELCMQGGGRWGDHPHRGGSQLQASWSVWRRRRERWVELGWGSKCLAPISDSTLLVGTAVVWDWGLLLRCYSLEGVWLCDPIYLVAYDNRELLVPSFCDLGRVFCRDSSSLFRGVPARAGTPRSGFFDSHVWCFGYASPFLAV